MEAHGWIPSFNLFYSNIYDVEAHNPHFNRVKSKTSSCSTADPSSSDRHLLEVRVLDEGRSRFNANSDVIMPPRKVLSKWRGCSGFRRIFTVHSLGSYLSDSRELRCSSGSVASDLLLIVPTKRGSATNPQSQVAPPMRYGVFLCAQAQKMQEISADS